MNEPKANRYQRLTRRAKAAEAVAGVGLLAALAFTPASRWLSRLVIAPVQHWPPVPRAAAATLAFVAAIVCLWQAIVIPIVVYLRWHVDRRFGKADRTPSSALVSHAFATVAVLASALVGAVIIVASTWMAGSFWWLAAGGLLACVLVGAARVTGTMLAAVGGATPVTRRSLMSALREVARRSGVPVSDILEWPVDRARATALVTGVGSTCRVFVASDVLREWSDDEIVVVVAHELAHHVHHDFWRTLALDVLVLPIALFTAQQGLSWFGIVFASAGGFNLSVLPLLLLVAGAVWLAARPIRLAQSRAHERHADQFALRLTGEAGAFGAAVRRLSVTHLAEEQPSRLVRWFFHRHPPVAERLAMAERFARQKAS